MRKEFSTCIEKLMGLDSRIVFLTGDLGFMALENIQRSMGNRFLNVGVSEQNMMTMAAGLAAKGLVPVCYSIAPFAVFRPAEQIRIDICMHNMDVKIVGNGGGYGYGIMGATHHALEDLAVLSSFVNMRCLIPFCNEDVDGAVKSMMERRGPSYLRLGYGGKPKGLEMTSFGAVRKIAGGDGVTVAALGPIALNALKALEPSEWSGGADLFVVSELPLSGLDEGLAASIRRTRRVLVLEEHVSRGGLAESLSLLILKNGIGCRLVHRCALGYPGSNYGSQGYHQKKCGLDAGGIREALEEMSVGG